MPKKKPQIMDKSQLGLFNGVKKVELQKIRLKKSNFKELREKHLYKYTNKEEFLKTKQKVFEELKKRYNKYDANPLEQAEVKFSKSLIDDVRADLIKKLNLLQESVINNITEQTKHNVLLNNKENKALYRLLFVFKREGVNLLKKLESIDFDLNYIQNQGPRELKYARSSQDANEIHQAIEDKSTKINERKTQFIDNYCEFRAKYSILSRVEFLNEFGSRFNLTFESKK